METQQLLKQLQGAGVVLLLIDGKLAVREDSIREGRICKVSPATLALLTKYRTQIKEYLLAMEAEAVTPYIDADYNMGRDGMGCLVMPQRCAQRYTYWTATDCVPVESDDWHDKLGEFIKKEDKLPWKPYTLLEILQELKASPRMLRQYDQVKSKKDTNGHDT